ncbi:transcriptional regulator [Acidianus sp. HS-5]|uniref:transcriptional regulator n=1 Tax=Acidianus sp. HS-5 TaxID=2886040 RepID=UPI001F250522|nr:transcriptional regulator [Acidianus sp. HS-5]BDC17742.1 transcriptional regulator [Acidianus sp. HS-5]
MSDDLKKLMEILNDPALNNSMRLGILLALYGLESINFSQLLKILNIPKSSLYTHLQVLEEGGYIKMTKKLTPLGPRTFIEITDKGKEVMRQYSILVNKMSEKK